MKKEALKGYVVGTVSTLLIAGTVVPVAAQNIDVMRGVKIFVDDMQLSGAEGFIYNGTTYLPVRQISDAVGKAVTWDGKTKSVYIGKHESSEPAVMLKDLDCFTSSGGGFSNYKSVKDNLGNTYHDAIRLGLRGNESEEYKINGRYSKIKGKLVLDFDDRSTKHSSWIKIYGDGRLLYTSPDVTGGIEPVDIDVDLTGVLTLKIESATDYLGLYSPEIYLVNTGLYQ